MPAAVGVVALAFWLPYSLRTGFVYDDWASAAGQHFHVALFTSYRPGSIVWEAVAVRLFGTDPLWYYLSSAVLMSAMAVLAVLALNGLGFPPLASAGVGLLLVVSSLADSLGLWWTASQMSLAMVLGLAAVTAGTRWMNRRSHGGIWLGLSVALLAAATLTYEAVAVIVFLPLALIGFSGDRKRVLCWSVPAVVVAAVAALFMFARAVGPNHKTARPVSQYPARIQSLIHTGTTTFVHHLVGFITGADALVAGAVAVACYGVWRAAGRPAPPLRTGAWWMGMTGFFLILGTYLSWAPFIPANDYYSPDQFGIGNRVNLLAQLFFLTAVVLLLLCVARALVSRRRAGAVGVVVVVGLFTVVLASSYSQTHQDQSDFLYATAQRQQILADVRQLLPRVADGDEILLGGYHLTASPQWVPVLSASWDTTGALSLLYDNGTITARPVSAALRCSAHGLTQPALEQVSTVPYRFVIVVDIATRSVERISGPSGCRAALATVTANPNPVLASSPA